MEKQIEKFTADWNKRLPAEEGKEIIEKGLRHGASSYQKDCYWSGYEKNGQYYISLNDQTHAVWLASYEDMKSHCIDN